MIRLARCLFGFAVSIVWIMALGTFSPFYQVSAAFPVCSLNSIAKRPLTTVLFCLVGRLLADEVVNVLTVMAELLGLSDAIVGLTGTSYPSLSPEFLSPFISKQPQIDRGTFFLQCLRSATRRRTWSPT